MSFNQEGTWAAEKVISIPPKAVQNWALPDMPGMSALLTQSIRLYKLNIFCSSTLKRKILLLGWKSFH